MTDENYPKLDLDEVNKLWDLIIDWRDQTPGVQAIAKGDAVDSYINELLEERYFNHNR